MVAYSFNRRFHDLVASGQKTQTVRAFRKRHARVGEPVQLYAGMRTKHCRKLVDPDPICTDIKIAIIEIRDDWRDPIVRITIDGRGLCDSEMQEFALEDGFRLNAFGDALQRMGRFWLAAHGVGTFEGVLIQWGAVE